MEPPGTILIVDDLEANRLLLRDMLEAGGHRVLEASNGPEAIDKAAGEQPEAVLLDVKMPEMDGFEVCRSLKSMAETSTIPVVFLTANYDQDADRLHGLELGAYDYLIKPISGPLLLARVAVMLRIRRADERIRHLSMIDEFTGLFSRKYVLHRLEEEIKRADRHRGPLVVAMLDLDDFKHCNDAYGHQFGDQVLKSVAAVLKANVRLYDSIGRYGGEEFLLLQPEVPPEEAMATVERLQEKVGDQRFRIDTHEVRITFSAGLSLWESGVASEELVRRADAALYAAKRSGKNQAFRYADVAAGVVPGKLPLGPHETRTPGRGWKERKEAEK